MDWKEQAFEMHFGKHMETVDISKAVGVSRQHISKYLRQFTGYSIEKEWRKKQSRIRRHESKRQWEREKRIRKAAIERDCLRKQHEEAVRVLSHEKY